MFLWALEMFNGLYIFDFCIVIGSQWVEAPSKNLRKTAIAWLRYVLSISLQLKIYTLQP